jgi:putative transposase
MHDQISQDRLEQCHPMDLWAYHNHVKIDFSRPGKPADNAFVESFNGTFRCECLDVH